MNDRQVDGTHYVALAIQPWEAMAAWMTPEEFRGYLLGNAIKYLARRKPGVPRRTDLQKAAHYLEKLIELTE